VDQVVSDPEYLLPPAERGLGFVFQSPALWPHLRVAQNIDFGIRDLPAAERRARLQASLARIGLESHADHFPAQLSGGQARRVSIARTLVSRPALLLLDEPLIYLDPNWKAEILSWILEIVAETAATLLVVTHDSMEVEGIAGRRLIMESGKILT
jgi:iron(III) transport system ATP-binding protein